MKGGQLRLLVALLNLGLLAAIGLLTLRIVKGSPFSEAQTPRETFNPRDFEIKDVSGPRSSIQEFAIVWQQYDRPKPPPAPVQPPPQPVQRPTVQSLGSRLRVVAVIASDDPDRSTAIVETRASGIQQMIKVGEKLQGYEVVAIRPDGESAVVTVRGPGAKDEEIRLTK